ncbi:MAG: dihydropteroate synthase [Candidatus Kapaibacterium sp.]
MNKLKIMGILNITPDSFSDGGLFFDRDAAVRRAIYMLEVGADIIDIGGESTRPGAEPVSPESEIARVCPIIEEIMRRRPECIISIDTTKYETARAAIDAGAQMINDVSALEFDERLGGLAANRGVPMVMMHMRGTPRTMQLAPEYDDVVGDIYSYLESRISFARKIGVKDIIADPGIGFGKTVRHNLELLRNLDKFRGLGVPIMLGVSRKSFLGKTLGIPVASERDCATAMLNSMLVNKNIDIIRVHNVGLHSQMRRLAGLLDDPAEWQGA